MGTIQLEGAQRVPPCIAVTDANINAGQLPKATKPASFVALADVPDIVWRAKRPKDAPSHFADMDEPGGAGEVAGRTLMQLWDSDEPKWRTPAGWTEFYDSLPTPPADEHRGSLPFRVAQLYDIMVAAVKDADVLNYVAAAGVLAHYIGDACQPLHVSRLHHGLPNDASDDKVHAVYETDMLDQFAPEVVTGVDSALSGYVAGGDGGPELVTGPDNAAAAVVALMERTIVALAPPEAQCWSWSN